MIPTNISECFACAAADPQRPCERHGLRPDEMVVEHAEIYACERCSVRPATQYDTYADQVVCHACVDGDSAYGCEFVLSYVPHDLSVVIPARPTYTPADTLQVGDVIRLHAEGEFHPHNQEER
jgi:hypothetical protein